MQLYELAKNLGAETKEVQKLLKMDSHMAVVTEEQIELAKSKYGKKELPNTPKQDKRILFVSTRKSHVIAQNDGDIVFKNFVYLCDRGSAEEQAIRSVITKYGDIHEVLNKRTEDELVRARLSAHLDEMVFSEDKPTMRGLDYLRAHFDRSEIADLMAGKNDVRVLLLRVLDKKSYSDWS